MEIAQGSSDPVDPHGFWPFDEGASKLDGFAPLWLARRIRRLAGMIRPLSFSEQSTSRVEGPEPVPNELIRQPEVTVSARCLLARASSMQPRALRSISVMPFRAMFFVISAVGSARPYEQPLVLPQLPQT
jgi:hypothetical protein